MVDTFVGDTIGRTQLDAEGAVGAVRARTGGYDPAQFIDVSYDDLVADPVGTAEAVYAHFGLPLGGAAADAMRALAGGGRGGSSHRYTLADFGLTAAEVVERFGPAIITR